jgi:hypothetical protein
MVPILVTLTVWLYRPDGPLATRLTFAPLLLAVLLGLLPVLLVVLGGVRSVEAGGVTIAFAAVQNVVNTRGVITVRSFIADNLGAPPGALGDSVDNPMVDSLQDATGSYCVVADLKEGDEWWDTRLLVLVAGAVRLASPKAVVFTSATPGRRHGFVGWATPSELLRRLLARDPKLRHAYDAAQGEVLRQLSIAAQPGSTASATTNDNFAPERSLLGQVHGLEVPDGQRTLSEVRVRELFGSILHTEAVERDDDEAKWVEAILTSTTDFFAVTRGHEFENLVPRRTAVNAVLLAMISGSDRTNGRASEPKT